MKQNVCKICRRRGEKLFLKGERCLGPKCSFIRRSYAPGIQGQKRRPRISDYGLQLQEKQKARAIYGVSEKQFRNYYKDAAKSQDPTADKIIQLLERRIDNVVFRLGLAPSRRAARQLVSHGIKLNGRKIDIPSYLVRINDVIEANIEPNKSQEAPAWLSYDNKSKAGKVKGLPIRGMIEHGFDPQLIVEYYSR